jgi:demethylmenaquinone methyltransferase / 2-methoxy-6-polyprenyl-1,4-benzoquinol methylase
MAHLSGEDRATYVRGMFSRIARRYGLMNRLMTAGQDRRWRRFVVERAGLRAGGALLDIATGTGDIACEALKERPTARVVGGDFNIDMMEVGRQDPQRRGILWVGADALALPFADGAFDAVTSGFLLRNVIDVAGALKEQLRVLLPGGRVVILESSHPKKGWATPFVRLYMNRVIPLLGWLVTGDREAYRYLPTSTQQFQPPEALAQMMEAAGFADVSYRLFMFGTAAVHTGRRPGGRLA